MTKLIAAHTPGPWTAGDSGVDVVWSVKMSDGTEVMQSDYASEGLTSADAHLIAAAPELLTALKAMVASYDGIRDAVAGRVVLNKLAAADAAIAKAEGRS